MVRFHMPHSAVSRAKARLAFHIASASTGATAGYMTMGPRGLLTGLGIAGATSTILRLTEDLYAAKSAAKVAKNLPSLDGQ